MGKIATTPYLGREFHWRDYNCWDFIRDVWLDYCGVDLGRRTPESLTVKAFQATFEAQEFDVDKQVVTRIDEPEEPCLVLFKGPNTIPHVGVYTEGRLLHLQPRGNVVLQDLASVAMLFTEVRFYK